MANVQNGRHQSEYTKSREILVLFDHILAFNLLLLFYFKDFSR